MAQKLNESALDENFEKIRKQSAKVFIGTTDPMVAEDSWGVQKEYWIDLIALLKRGSTMQHHYSNKMP